MLGDEMPSIEFYGDLFDETAYVKLPNLDQMRYDICALYDYLYKNHAHHFTGLACHDQILKPRPNSIVAINRQLSLMEMGYAIRGILSLFEAHLSYLATKPFSDKQMQKVYDSMCDITDIVHADANLFIAGLHGDRFRTDIPYLAFYQNEGQWPYYPSTADEWISDFNVGLSYLCRYTLLARAATPTPIVISYRNDGKGKGAIYDHATFQQITGRDTVITADWGSTKPCFLDLLTNFDQPRLTLGVPYEKDVSYMRPLYASELGAELIKDSLLVIPGVPEFDMSRYSPAKLPIILKDAKDRAAYENRLLTESINRRPILAICGGLYRLLGVLGQEIVNVDGHSGSMPHFEGGDLVDNDPKHPIVIASGSKLASLLGYTQTVMGGKKAQLWSSTMNVTSVHHKAAKEPFSHDFNSNYAVVAYAKRPAGHKGSFSESVEAIERLGDGPSVVGMQSHPESATGDSSDERRQQNMINALAEEGDRLQQSNARRQMAELSNHYYGIFNVLRIGRTGSEEEIEVRLGLLHEVKRRLSGGPIIFSQRDRQKARMVFRHQAAADADGWVSVAFEGLKKQRNRWNFTMAFEDNLKCNELLSALGEDSFPRFREICLAMSIDEKVRLNDALSGAIVVRYNCY